MNERIRHFETAATEWFHANFPPDWLDRVDEFLPLWNDKFAELIIEECAAIADEFADEQLVNKPSDRMKRLFGVK